MKIKDLILKNECTLLSGSEETEINEIVMDSRIAKNGDMFIAIKGEYTDGHNYIDQVLERGVTVIAITNPQFKINLKNITFILVKSGTLALAKLADDFYGQPSCKLIGITGTNGKTTTSYVVRNLLEKSGIKTGLISTIAYEYDQRSIPAERTTPDIFTLYSLLHKMSARDVKIVVMEVSSHAVHQKRIGYLKYDVAIFTNLTPDHLDYHKTMDNYYEAKKVFFSSLKMDGVAIINISDYWGKKLASELNEKYRVCTFGINEQTANYNINKYETNINGSVFTLVDDKNISYKVESPLLGKHNIENCLAALVACGKFNIELAILIDHCKLLNNVPGRLEFVKNKDMPLIVVDYAHTENAIKSVLECLRGITIGKLWIVFGCGGDRDKTKRPKMGAVAEQIADKVVVTTDNPRTEIPSEIINDILSGMHTNKYITIEDRRAAIKYACESADASDIILIAGKGHEKYQEINRIVYEFDEIKIIYNILENIKK